jgi:hypothetical protein
MGDNSKPESINDKPENPALHFDLIGPLVKAEQSTVSNPHGGSQMNPTAGSNALDFYLGEDGKLRYFWKSRTKGEFSGEIEKGKAVPMYAPPGAEFLIDQMIPRAEPKLAYAPLPPDTFAAAEEGRTGVHCRITAGGETKDVWVGWMDLTGVLTKPTPAGETIDLPSQKWEHIEVGGRKIDLAVINEYRMLPFTVSLLKFYAPHPEGEEDMNTFSAFESTLAFDDHKDVVQLRPDAKLLKEQGITDQNPAPLWGAIIDENETSVTMEFDDRQQVMIPRSDILHYVKKSHKIYMNYPTTYPETWYGPWMGTSYKFSQAGHDLPNNPDYSNVQVLRDPGWMPKWIGCLMICFGIFTMFYLKPYFNRRPAVAAAAETSKKAKGKEKVAEAAAVRSES